MILGPQRSLCFRPERCVLLYLNEHQERQADILRTFWGRKRFPYHTTVGTAGFSLSRVLASRGQGAGFLRYSCTYICVTCINIKNTVSCDEIDFVESHVCKLCVMLVLGVLRARVPRVLSKLLKDIYIYIYIYIHIHVYILRIYSNIDLRISR